MDEIEKTVNKFEYNRIEVIGFEELQQNFH